MENNNGEKKEEKQKCKCQLSGLALLLVAHAAMMFVSITFSLWNVLAEQVVEKKASAKLGSEPSIFTRNSQNIIIKLKPYHALIAYTPLLAEEQ